MVDSKRPDLNFEVGYDLKSQKATFSIGISNIFERVGKRQFGFSASRWWTKRKGKVDAKHLLPLTSATRPDGREEEIHTQRDQQLTKVSSAVTQLTQDADDWITDHKPESLNADTLKSDIRAALNGALAPYRRRFQDTREEFVDSLAQYQEFRSENNLRRHAEVPLFFLKPFVILLALLLFETLVNSAIFAGISAQGLIGGWVTAVMISTVNILLGLVFGILIIRYARIMEGHYKYALMAAGGLLVIAATFFNLYVAHFREVAEEAIIASQSGEIALTRAMAPRFNDAWPHFLQNPFNLGTVLGVALFVIGLCVFGWATYEGYRGFTDPFPGFGKVGKRFFIMRILRVGLEDAARQAGFDVLDRARERIDTSSRLHSHFKNQVSIAVSFAQRLSKAAATAESRINNHAWSLLSAYRSSNRRQRIKMHRKATRKPIANLPDPGDPPNYFDEDPRSNGQWVSVVPDADSLAARAGSALDGIDRNIETLDIARKYISDLRASIDEQLRQALDEEDMTLNRQAAEIIDIKPSKVKTIKNEAA
ncbi:hypothetical protein [Hyphomonas jannaschiana]|uniref:hypothetical protein n=1 Tax=Hyphomonas jannaschiana TaxID=86 RepID=UPI0035C6C02C